MRSAAFLSFLLLSGAAIAQPPQKPAPKSAPKPKAVESESDLLAQLKKAESAEAAKPIEEKLALMYRTSGSASVDLLMTRARALVVSDRKAARKLINSVTNIAPRYAEGWRTRAALESAMGEDAAAMVSLQKTVQLNPRHFMALVELGDLLQEYGDKAQALKLYRQAVALHPQMEGAEMRIRELTRAVEGRDI